MASLTFYLRSSRRGGEDYPGRLCLRIIHRRQGKSQSTPFRLSRDDFNLLEQGGADVPSRLDDVRQYMQDVRETSNVSPALRMNLS